MAISAHCNKYGFNRKAAGWTTKTAQSCNIGASATSDGTLLVLDTNTIRPVPVVQRFGTQGLKTHASSRICGFELAGQLGGDWQYRGAFPFLLALLHQNDDVDNTGAPTIVHRFDLQDPCGGVGQQGSMVVRRGPATGLRYSETLNIKVHGMTLSAEMPGKLRALFDCIADYENPDVTAAPNNTLAAAIAAGTPGENDYQSICSQTIAMANRGVGNAPAAIDHDSWELRVIHPQFSKLTGSSLPVATSSEPIEEEPYLIEFQVDYFPTDPVPFELEMHNQTAKSALVTINGHDTANINEMRIRLPNMKVTNVESERSQGVGPQRVTYTAEMNTDSATSHASVRPRIVTDPMGIEVDNAFAQSYNTVFS